MLCHLKRDNRQTRPWADVMRRIAIQELSGGAFQVSLQADDVVRGQELIQVTATPIKTYDARTTRKLEGVVYRELLEISHLGRNATLIRRAG
jgi:hypothetical protein